MNSVQIARRLAAFGAAVLIAGCSRPHVTRVDTVSLGDGSSMTTTAIATGTDAGVPIVFPKYPGAHFEPEPSRAASDGRLISKTFSSPDSAAKVAAWYRAHLPAPWAATQADTATVFAWSGKRVAQRIIVVASGAGASILTAATRD